MMETALIVVKLYLRTTRKSGERWKDEVDGGSCRFRQSTHFSLPRLGTDARRSRTTKSVVTLPITPIVLQYVLQSR